MTALTTILALITMAFGYGMGAEMVQPMAIVCVGGLTYATFMTLFVVPVMYDLFHRKVPKGKKKLGQKGKKKISSLRRRIRDGEGNITKGNGHPQCCDVFGEEGTPPHLVKVADVAERRELAKVRFMNIFPPKRNC